ncbi:hypothetical protein EV356DRAFT_579714 [Viridothelium virens]|uniref:SMP-30/Gluconolactonase/LRE-like region domain-containing protein n=1 Tax=Viridothelium virens TaxID=1048519 RepID=A0A6A6GZ53_VIRVR|nr:hypothetical protein EV356DRAFT_579714 [Viridothelium virens]
MEILIVIALVLFSYFQLSVAAPVDQDPTLDTGANLTFALPAHVVHEFPEDTWIENLAVRSNGQILATEDSKPRIYQVDPFSKRNPIIIHEFNETASVLGIAEGAPDVFFVCTANYSSKLLQGYGEAYIFQVDMRGFSEEIPGSAKVSKVATIPGAGALDGLVYLGDDSSLLLVSDFLVGIIWSVDTTTGEVKIPINNTYTQSTGFGANGLRLHGQELYFTNSQHESLVRVPINSQGEAIGDFTVLAEGGFTPDDLAVDSQGDAYVTSFTIGKNGLVFIPRDGGQAMYIAGMAGPTSCAFGRTAIDRDTLYVSTSGGDYQYSTGNKVTVSGKILRVEVARHKK